MTGASERQSDARDPDMSGGDRQLIAELFVSLDGDAFSAKAGPYFDLYGPELGALIEERVAEPQELVMGRRTYQLLGGYAASPESNDPLARPMDELPKTVLSHDASLPLQWTPARVVGGELPEVIGELKREPGPMLRMIGSVSVVRDLAAAQLLDQLRLVVFPIVLGPDGEEPIFAGHLRTNLELVASRVLDGRLLALDYRPLPR
jgi:dihydrofolate reductase